MDTDQIILIVFWFLTVGFLITSIALFIGSYFWKKINRKTAGLLVILAIIAFIIFAQISTSHDFSH